MKTDDAILVNMALEGKPEAFDELVKKHRARVVFEAQMLLNDTDGAEDAAQQAFVEAFVNLRSLRDRNSFRPWLITIVRRCATRRRAVQFRETPGIFETVIASMESQTDASSEIEARVSEMLAELSARSRKVLTMHYLDGYSCQEIGKSLGIPAGTVKRILHESRMNLRASSELKRSAGKMSHKQQGPRHMIFWVNGSYPHGVMDKALPQSICLTINKTAKTPEQIAKSIDANVVYVRETMDALEAEGLIEKTGRGRYRTAFVALDAADLIEINADIRTRAEYGGELLMAALPDLEAAWESSPKSAQGFDWNTGIWPVLNILVCLIGAIRNSTFHVFTAHPDGPKPPLHPASGKLYWGGGREKIEDELFWLNDASVPGFAYGYFSPFGIPFRNRLIDWPDERRVLLEAIAQGARDVDSAAHLKGMDIEKAREMASNAIEQGLLERTPDGLSITFPVFTAEDDNALLPAVDKICEQISREVLDPVGYGVDDKLRKLGYGHLEEQFHNWRRWLTANAARESLRALSNKGVFTIPSEPVPARFYMIGWMEPLGLFAYSK